ncbi:MAG: MFS transporter [Chloroflexi bacterium]|nr:MFS transporter [Chloroflexota bacterium]
MASTRETRLDGRQSSTSEAANRSPSAEVAPVGRLAAIRLGGRGWRALRQPNYRLYFFGQVVSQSGTWLQRIAQAWLVLDVANSPAALGVLTVFQFTPALALSLVAGVVADRVGKQRLIMITSTLEALQALAMAAVTFSGNVQLWQIYLLAFLLGLFTTFETPARQAFVSELVPREDIQSAVALNSSVFNAARVVGPGIGGIILAAWGAGWAFALNGVSYLAVLAALFMLDSSKLYTSRRAARGALWSQVWDGLRHAAHVPELAYPLGLLAVIGLFGYNFGVVLPLLARYTLDVGAVGFGALNAAMGVGSLLGALLLTPHLPPGLRSVSLAGFGFSLALLAVAVVPNYSLILGLLAVLGLLSVIYSTSTNTTLQLSSGEAFRGRVLSLYTLLFMGTTPIGGAITGVLADQYGITATLAVEAAVCLLATLVGFAYLRWGRGARLTKETTLAG